MKYLTLIRHAKSSWDDSGLDDFERPLNERGEKDAPRVGQMLERELGQRGWIPRPGRLISSPACRALSTARIIAREIGYPEDHIQEEPRVYEAGPQELFSVIHRIGEPVVHAVLVGHNPGFEMLAHLLDPRFQGDGEKFPTCGAAMMELKATSWPQVAEGCAVRSVFFCPRSL